MEASACAHSPPEHWRRRRIRTNNGNERLGREARRRTKTVASFPDGRVAMMLAAARCKYIAEGNWETKRYLDANLLEGWEVRGRPKLGAQAQEVISPPAPVGLFAKDY